MVIAIGDRFPNSSFKIMSKNGPTDVTSDEFLSGKKIVLFAVPGAFTPTCHLNHLPGFLENLEIIKSKGVDEVYVLSVNDVWVMNEWSKSTKGKYKIGFLSDGSAIVTTALGMDVDAGPAGMGIRSKRYSMLIENGIVKTLNIEVKRGEAIVSGSATILEQL